MTCTNDQGLINLIWQCCVSYSTSIGIVFGSLKTLGGQFQQVETDVDFVIGGISSILNDNW